MENLIYNELRIRGFNVDVGFVPVVVKDNDGKQKRLQLILSATWEVDDTTSSLPLEWKLTKKLNKKVLLC